MNHETSGAYMMLAFNVDTVPARRISPRAEYVDRVYGRIAKMHCSHTEELATNVHSRCRSSDTSCIPHTFGVPMAKKPWHGYVSM